MYLAVLAGSHVTLLLLCRYLNRQYETRYRDQNQSNRNDARLDPPALAAPTVRVDQAELLDGHAYGRLALNEALQLVFSHVQC